MNCLLLKRGYFVVVAAIALYVIPASPPAREQVSSVYVGKSSLAPQSKLKVIQSDFQDLYENKSRRHRQRWIFDPEHVVDNVTDIKQRHRMIQRAQSMAQYALPGQTSLHIGSGPLPDFTYPDIFFMDRTYITDINQDYLEMHKYLIDTYLSESKLHEAVVRRPDYRRISVQEIDEEHGFLPNSIDHITFLNVFASVDFRDSVLERFRKHGISYHEIATDEIFSDLRLPLAKKIDNAKRKVVSKILLLLRSGGTLFITEDTLPYVEAVIAEENAEGNVSMRIQPTPFRNISTAYEYDGMLYTVTKELKKVPPEDLAVPPPLSAGEMIDQWISRTVQSSL